MLSKVATAGFLSMCVTASAAEYAPYTGAADDLDYLKGYVEQAIGSPPGFFDVATVENTARLRDFVHQSNFRFYANGRPSSECLHDVGCMFRKQVGQSCGFMTISLLAIFEAFGFEARGYNTIDGTLSGPLKYRDSHVLPEVWIPDLHKYVVQDPTFNLSFEQCSSHQPLSFDEIQAAILDGEKICTNAGTLHPEASDRPLTPKALAGMFDDYYGATRLATIKYDGPEWSRVTWAEIDKKPARPAPSPDAYTDAVAECSGEPGCVDAIYGTHVIWTSNIAGDATSALYQYSTADGQMRAYDPATKQHWPFGLSGIQYRYVFSSWSEPGEYRRFIKPLKVRLSGGREIIFPQ